MKNHKSHVNNNVTIFVEGMGFVGVGSFKSPDVVWKKIKVNG